MPDFETPVLDEDVEAEFGAEDTGFDPPEYEPTSREDYDRAPVDDLSFEEEMNNEDEDSNDIEADSNAEESVEDNNIEDGEEPDSTDTPGDEDAANIKLDEGNEGQGIPIDLIIRAGQLGMSSEDVEAYGNASPEILSKHMDAIESFQGQHQEQQEQGENESPASNDFNLEEFKLDLGEDHDFDEKLVGNLQSMAEHNHAQTQKAFSAAETVGQGLLNMHNRMIEGQMNDFIDDLSNDKSGDFKTSLGSGVNGMLSDSQKSNRDKVLDFILSDSNDRVQKGLPVASTKKSFNTAMTSLFNRETSKNSKTQVQLGKRQRSGFIQGTKKDAPKNGKKFSPQAKAAKALNEKYGDMLSD